jgi:RimJ/RimL family protein N-acetyltransferase
LGVLIGDKKWRNKGVLKEVFPIITKFLIKCGILRIELGVDVKNKIAILAFKRLGFVKSDINECKLVKKERNDQTIYFHKILKNLKK